MNNNRLQPIPTERKSKSSKNRKESWEFSSTELFRSEKIPNVIQPVLSWLENEFKDHFLIKTILIITMSAKEVDTVFIWSKELAPAVDLTQDFLKLINDQLRKFGLTTWFDEKPVGNKDPMLSGVSKAKTCIICLTEAFQKKVNSMNTDDACNAAFSSAVHRLSAKRVVIVSIDKKMNDVSSWKGRIAAEFATLPVFDFSDLYEKFAECRQVDLVTTEQKCHDIRDHMLKVNADKSIPAILTTKLEDLRPSTDSILWIQPFFDTIEKKLPEQIKNKFEVLDNLLLSHPFMHKHLQSLNYEAVFVKLLKFEERLELMEAFLLLLLEAQGCLIIPIFQAILNVLSDNLKKQEFLSVLCTPNNKGKIRIISILINVFQYFSDKVQRHNIREAFALKTTSFSLISALLENEAARNLLRSWPEKENMIFQVVDGKYVLHSSLILELCNMINLPQDWERVSEKDLKMLVSGLKSYKGNGAFVFEVCKTISFLLNDPSNRAAINNLDMTNILLDILAQELLIHNGIKNPHIEIKFEIIHKLNGVDLKKFLIHFTQELAVYCMHSLSKLLKFFEKNGLLYATNPGEAVKLMNRDAVVLKLRKYKLITDSNFFASTKELRDLFLTLPEKEIFAWLLKNAEKVQLPFDVPPPRSPQQQSRKTQNVPKSAQLPTPPSAAARIPVSY
jgi:hypothetical protein